MKARKSVIYLVCVLAIIWTCNASAKDHSDAILVDFGDIGQTEVLSFEIGAENNINIGSISGGGGAGKATFKEVTITRRPDSLSSELLAALAQGTHFETVTIDQDNLRITLKLVMVSSWNLESETEKKELAQTETLILQYGAMQLSVFE